jgi:hypothetical protein
VHAGKGVRMKWSFLWQYMSATSLFVAFILCGQAYPQGNETYNNAVNLHERYKRNHAEIEALDNSIADHQAAIRAIQRDYAAVSHSTGSIGLVRDFDAELAPHRDAIARDRAVLDRLQRRQSIIEHNWDRNKRLRTYYGPLRETSNRSIYDPKTRKYVNLMDYRLDSFRNPGNKQSPPKVRGPSGDARSSNARIRTQSRKSAQSRSHGNRTSTVSKSGSSRSKKSKGSSGGTHSISLTPVEE